jgi:hypothetical protein
MSVRDNPFPLQRRRVRGADGREQWGPEPTSIPWPVAEVAYREYARRYGTYQSLERLAERGGFGISEMDDFHPGWRKEVGC